MQKLNGEWVPVYHRGLLGQKSVQFGVPGGRLPSPYDFLPTLKTRASCDGRHPYLGRTSVVPRDNQNQRSVGSHAFV